VSTPANRRVCSACGANNFDTQARCWQCGGSLNESSVSTPAGAAPRSVDHNIVSIASAALAFLTPAVALIVGLVFIMLGDPDRVRTGKRTLGFAVAGLIVHLIATPIVAKILLTPLLGGLTSLIPKIPQSTPDSEAELLRRGLSGQP
jgi:hypothetical protein